MFFEEPKMVLHGITATKKNFANLYLLKRMAKPWSEM